MSATTALRQSRYQTVAQTAARPNTSIILPSALLPEKESWPCSEQGTRIGSKHPPSVVHTEGIFILVTNYTSVPLSPRRLLLNLFRHVDQTKAVEHPMDHPTKPSLAHVILDLLLSPTYRLSRTVTAVRIYRDENIFSVCPRCDACIEREYQGYCHRCGQYLDWSKLEDAEEIFIGWSGFDDD